MKKLLSVTAVLLSALILFAGCMEQPTPADSAPEETAAETTGPDETTADDETAAEPDETTVKAEESTSAEQTSTPEETAKPAETTAKEETTAVKETTAVEETTAEETTIREETTEKPDETTVPHIEPAVTYDFRDFDGDLMKFISEKTDGNYMISPLSFKYALGMLLAGAGGSTLDELKSALGINDISELDDGIKAFNHFIEGFEDSFKQELKDYGEYVEKGWASADEAPFRALRVADSVWKRNNINRDFTNDYKLKLEMYGAEYRTFDTGSVIDDVNGWVKEKTEGMIPEILPADYDTENLAVMLVNALYFKDSWKTPFTENELISRDFTASDGNKIKKDFMTAEMKCRYYKDDKTELAAVEMNGNVSMVFVLGDTEGFSEKLAKAERRTVLVTVPVFETETSLNNYELCEFLSGRGVNDLFSENADLKNMIDWDIYVNDIIQKTKIKVNQTGIEAAAVTAILAPDKAYIPPEDQVIFTADRAFSYFIITDPSPWTETDGIILFEGELVK